MNAIVLLDDNNRIRSVLNPAPFSTGIPLQVSTVTLTDSQIKASTVTSVALISPTETLNASGFPRTIPKLLSVFAILDSRNGAYTIDDEGSLVIQIGAPDIGSATDIGKTVKFQASSPFVSVANVADIIGQQTFSFVIADGGMQTDFFTDNGIYLYMNGSNVTGGGSGNSLRVIVYYTVVDVS